MCQLLLVLLLINMPLCVIRQKKTLIIAFDNFLHFLRIFLIEFKYVFYYFKMICLTYYKEIVNCVFNYSFNLHLFCH